MGTSGVIADVKIPVHIFNARHPPTVPYPRIDRNTNDNSEDDNGFLTINHNIPFPVGSQPVYQQVYPPSPYILPEPLYEHYYCYPVWMIPDHRYHSRGPPAGPGRTLAPGPGK